MQSLWQEEGRGRTKLQSQFRAPVSPLGPPSIGMRRRFGHSVWCRATLSPSVSARDLRASAQNCARLSWHSRSPGTAALHLNQFHAPEVVQVEDAFNGLIGVHND